MIDQKIILVVSTIDDLLGDVLRCLKDNQLLVIPRKNFYVIRQYLNGKSRLNYDLIVLPDTTIDADDGIKLVRELTNRDQIAITYSAQKALELYRSHNGQGCGEAVEYIAGVIRGAL